jgi:hypothetical protein
MKEKTRKILRIIFTIIAVLWIFSETISDSPELTKIIEVLIIWGILMSSLREEKQIYENIDAGKKLFYPNCGAKLQENASFCFQCGEKIKI